MDKKAIQLHKYLAQARDNDALDQNLLNWIQIADSHEGRQDQLGVWLQSTSTNNNEIETHLSSPQLSSFLARLAASEGGTSVFDPTCGSGLLLSSTARELGATSVTGIEISPTIAQVADLITPQNSNIIRGDSLAIESDQKYDVIVAELPFGVSLPNIYNPFEDQSLPVRQLGYALVAKWIKYITENGRGVFMLPVSCISQRFKDLWNGLSEYGFHTRAMIHVPAGNLRTTRLESYIVILDRTKRDEVFTAQFSHEPQQQKQVIENYLAHRSGSRLATGRLVDLASFIGLKAIEASERLLFHSRKAQLNAIPFKDLVDDISLINQRNCELKDGENIVFLPQSGRYDAFLNADEAPEGKNIILLRIVIKQELISARFMMDTLNDDSGRLYLESVSHAASSITVVNLDALMESTIYIPSREIQNQILDARSKIIALQAELEDLESRLSVQPTQIERLTQQLAKVNHEDSLESWLEDLPFPLASILWRYCATREQSSDRNDTLLHFFEALAQFWATIYLSAAKSDPDFWAEHVEPLNKALADIGLSFDRATFGLWKCVVEYFRKPFNRMLKGGSSEDRERCAQMFATQSSDVLNMLVDSRIATVLQKSNGIRNSHAHGGVLDDTGIVDTHRQLIDLLQTCRAFMGSNWNRFQLIQPEQADYNDEDRWNYNVRLIMGTRTPFAHDERVTDSGMRKSLLHLLDPESGHSLELLPFVKVMPSPQAAHNACYFYNKQQPNGQVYVSYHFESESHIEEMFEDTNTAIEGLKPFE